MNTPYADYRVRVHPRAHTDSVIILPDGRIEVHTTCPAENGLANMDIIRQLSLHFSVPHKQVIIIKGHTSPSKHVRVYGA